MNNNINKLIKIYWDDAVIYTRPPKKRFQLKKRITEGALFKEGTDFFIVQNPTTFDYDANQKQYVLSMPNKKITFFLIPKGMIVKIIKK